MGYQDKQKELEMCYGILAKFEEDLKDCKEDIHFLSEQEEKTIEYVGAAKAAATRADELKVAIKILNERIDELENR